MSDQFNEKHLLWWVLKAINACCADGTRPDTLFSETMWKNIGAPDWVLPAIREKYDAISSSGTIDLGGPIPLSRYLKDGETYFINGVPHVYRSADIHS